MSHALIPLPDVYESVTRKVMVDIVAQISRVMQLPENTHVLIPGNEKAIPMNGGEFGSCCDSGVRYDPEERIVVEYDEVADEQFTLTTSVNNKQNFPIFEDPMRGIAFRPVRRYVDVRIDVEIGRASCRERGS